ncbi:MAG: tyrosine-type recombinase/integrase [Planctomycetes bacterium]|nr:tyrosine-type recombinase/integrase [Planctomycetota bacterium]
MQDIYKTDARLETALARVKDAPGLVDADRAAIVHFVRDSLSNGLSSRRVLKYALVLRQMAEQFDGPLTAITEESARAYVRRLDAKPISPYTKMDYKLILRSFARWLRRSEEYPPEVKWIRAHVRASETKLPEDLLTPAEAVAMANATEHLRDRAIIALLYESGMRIGELLGMRVGSVRPDPNGAVLTVTGKTGGRRILIVESVPVLLAWLAEHPDVRQPDAPLWCSLGPWNRHHTLTHAGVLRMIKRVALRAGLAKRVHPHLFRHSRASLNASRFTEAQMNAYFGWIQGSDMPRTYVHLSGRDVDNAVLAMHGLRRADEHPTDAPTRPSCPKCRATVLATAVSCTRCWQPLLGRPVSEDQSSLEFQQAQSLMAELVKNPLFLQALAQVKAARSTPPGAAAPTQVA